MQQNISLETVNLLKKLAEKNENSKFLENDPSQFLRYFKNPEDAEICGFLASLLSFGNRKQFIPKIKIILEMTGNSIKDWIVEEKFYSDFRNLSENQNNKFYRFYSFQDFITLFEEIKQILQKSNSFGNYFKEKSEIELEKLKNQNLSEEKFNDSKKILLSNLISSEFPKSKIVPKGKNSAKKRINMFLRWMIRTSSPVDLGIWSWWNKKNLLIPLDTHVLQQSKKLYIIEENESGTLKTALKLTKKMEQIWPEDPVKADFALFSLGVNDE